MYTSFVNMFKKDQMKTRNRNPDNVYCIYLKQISGHNPEVPGGDLAKIELVCNM